MKILIFGLLGCLSLWCILSVIIYLQEMRIEKLNKELEEKLKKS